MDDWNDFGPAPPDPSSQNFYAEPNSSSQGSYTSLLGSQGPRVSRAAEEPRSIFLVPRRSSGRSEAHAPNRSTSDPVPLEPGDLDDDPDFEDIGSPDRGRDIPGYPGSAIGRYHRKSYTKLEVISARQIQQLIHIFHAVVAIAVAWTLFTLIICNTLFVRRVPVLVKPVLLTPEQQRKSDQLGRQRQSLGQKRGTKARRKDARDVKPGQETPNRPGILPEDGNRHSRLTPTPSPAARVLRWPEINASLRKSSTVEEKASFEKIARCHGEKLKFVVRFLEINEGKGLDCSPSHPCADLWKDECQLDKSQGSTSKFLSGVSRQSSSNGNTKTKTAADILGPAKSRYSLIHMRIVVERIWYKLIIHFVLALCAIVSLILGVLFLVRLNRVGRKNVAHEQIWACLQLFVAFLYFNLPLSVLQLGTIFHINGSPFPPWFNIMEKPLRVIRDTAFASFCFFFLWANIHTFRILDPTQKLGKSFYLPKIAIILPYAVLKASSLYSLNLILSEVPFASAITVQHCFGALQMWKALRPQLIYAIVVSLVEGLLIVLLIVESVRTLRVLRRAPYMRHRSKQIGFRFFAYFNFAFYSTFLIMHIILIVGRPRGEMVALHAITGTALFFLPWTHAVGPTLLTLGYVVVLAYVNLPYDSIGVVKGWFKGTELAPSSSRWSFASAESISESDPGSSSGVISTTETLLGNSQGERTYVRDQQHQPTFIVDKDYELNQEIVEPITYRKRESEDALELKANCFTMQTHVIMFNFAWYVYYYGTPKLDNIKPKESPLPFRFSVAESISEPYTDTHALVIDGFDRIIVTFKGTTSMRNLQTSINIYHERLVNVVPTDMDGQSELSRLRIIFGRSYEAAKIHKGFAIAYASVSQRVMRRIKMLIDQKPRPVFLTGHSLGGALATICSLDVWIKLRISRREIFVSTFGSPRVGNEAFRRIYNSVIALHWRIVVDPDMIAKLPKIGYRHVGKKVLLTPHGEMFIDPNALELKLWSGNTAGFAYHRKASYMLAMRAWCVRHHQMSYTPVFWPFPVRDEDIRRFEGANVGTDATSTGGKGLARKIIRRDANIELLDNGGYSNMAVIEKWSRLTRRLLLDQKLRGSVHSHALQ